MNVYLYYTLYIYIFFLLLNAKYNNELLSSARHILLP